MRILQTSSLLESLVARKRGCRVRRGLVGKVPINGNSLACYPTKQDRRRFSMYDVASEMLNAQKYLEIVRKPSIRRKETYEVTSGEPCCAETWMQGSVGACWKSTVIR